MHPQQNLDRAVGLILTVIGAYLTGLGSGVLYGTTAYHNTALLSTAFGTIITIAGVLIVILSSTTE